MEEYKSAVEELLTDMIQSRDHCPQSIKDLRTTADIPSLITLLNRYRPNLNRLRFPDTRWMRRHFAPQAQELERYGLFLDSNIDLVIDDDSPSNIWLYGNCTGTITVSSPKARHIIANDCSRIEIHVTCPAVLFIVQKDPTAQIAVTRPDSAIVTIKHPDIYVSDNKHQ